MGWGWDWGSAGRSWRRMAGGSGRRATTIADCRCTSRFQRPASPSRRRRTNLLEVAQPLTAVLLNVRVLQRMLKTRRATAEETDEILADIQAEAALAAQISDRHRTMLR